MANPLWIQLTVDQAAWQLATQTTSEDMAPEVAVAILFGVLGTILGLTSLIAQLVTWQREGPLLRISLYPAALLSDGRTAVALRMADVPGAIGEAISVAIYSTGRQPVYFDSVRLSAVPPKPKRVWRQASFLRVRRRLHLVKRFRAEPAIINLEGAIINDAKPYGRIDAAERRDLIVDLTAAQELERRAIAAKCPGTIWAEVTLGTGRSVRSKPYSVSNPPSSAFGDIEYGAQSPAG